MIKAMRENTGNPPPRIEEMEKVRQRLIVIKQRLETHNDLEEKQVYRWSALLFDEQRLFALFDHLRYELENTPPRFTKITSPAHDQ